MNIKFPTDLCRHYCHSGQVIRKQSICVFLFHSILVSVGFADLDRMEFYIFADGLDRAEPYSLDWSTTQYL